MDPRRKLEEALASLWVDRPDMPMQEVDEGQGDQGQ
jgi:hypothetical protein